MKNPQLRSTTDALLLEQHINVVRNYGNLHHSRGSGWTWHQLWIQQISHFSRWKQWLLFLFFSNSRPAWGPCCCPCYITPLLAVCFIKLSLMVANWPAASRICCVIVDGSAGAHRRPSSADCMSANSLWQWPQWDQTSRSGNFIKPEDYRPLAAGLLPMSTTVTPRFSITMWREVN